MDISVIFVVLGAAFLHAFWNFRVRGTEDKALGMAAVMFGHLPLAMIGLVYVGLPPSGAWPYVMVSAVLHLGYQVFLLNAYRFGELTQIYPVARGACHFDYPFHHDNGSGVLQTMERDWRNYGFWRYHNLWRGTIPQ